MNDYPWEVIVLSGTERTSRVFLLVQESISTDYSPKTSKKHGKWYCWNRNMLLPKIRGSWDYPIKTIYLFFLIIDYWWIPTTLLNKSNQLIQLILRWKLLYITLFGKCWQGWAWHYRKSFTSKNFFQIQGCLRKIRAFCLSLLYIDAFEETCPGNKSDENEH